MSTLTEWLDNNEIYQWNCCETLRTKRTIYKTPTENLIYLTSEVIANNKPYSTMLLFSSLNKSLLG